MTRLLAGTLSMPLLAILAGLAASGTLLAQDNAPPAAVAAAAVAPADTSPVPDAMPAKQSASPENASPENPAPPDAPPAVEPANVEPADEEPAAPPPAPEIKPDVLELLTLFGVDRARLDGFADGAPIGPDESDLLHRMLYAVGRFKLAEIHRWKHEPTAWTALVDDPAPLRGQIFQFRGRATRVTRVDLPDEIADRFIIGEQRLERFYRCELITDDRGNPATVYALDVPGEWKLDEPIDERAGVQGFFVKLAGSGAEPRPVFVAQRVAWYPETILGDLGMDYGLFDDVDPKGSLVPEERLCFYDLLDAAGRSTRAQLLKHARAVPVSALFPHRDPKSGNVEEPTVQRGELVVINGTATRAIMIQVDDPEIVAVHGIDHYYEIELVNLDTQGNPITFCVRKLPPGMNVGESISVDVRLAGFFFKLWSYRRSPLSEEELAGDKRAPRQLAPLLIGIAPLLIEREPRPNFIGWAACILFVVGMIAMWITVWWLRRSDQQVRQRTIARKFAPPEGASLDTMDVEDQGPIRFDNAP